MNVAEIWQRIFFSPVRRIVQTDPLWKQSFTKTLFKPEKFNEKRCSFSVDGKPSFETKLFENNDIMIVKLFPCSSFTQTQIPRGVDGKYLMRFQSETTVFKFFRPSASVDGAFSHIKDKIKKINILAYGSWLHYLIAKSCFFFKASNKDVMSRNSFSVVILFLFSYCKIQV